MRRLLTVLCTAIAFGALAQSALASGGSYSFAGGTARQQASVRAALGASSFDWGLIGHPVTIHVGAYGDSYSTSGDVYLDSSLLDAGRVAWGVVQHEMAHQVDFFLLDDAKRSLLQQRLGGQDWCYSVAGLAHAQYGCERFASELAWAYWPAADNTMRPTSAASESAGMPVADFRALLAQLLNAPSVASAPPTTKAFAPVVAKKKRR